jgi:putative transcriptional regulator
MIENRVGKLLIAHPNLPEDNFFHKSVIYIYTESDELGTLGLVLNKSTGTTVRHVAQRRNVLFPYRKPEVYKGGPVSEHALILFHTAEWRGTNTTSAGPGYCLTSDNYMFERIAMGDQPAYWKMCLGLCGWKPGQLDMELAGQFPFDAANSWLTADANDHILFNLDGEKMWNEAVKLSSEQMFSTYF